jgi:hypothetical protein
MTRPLLESALIDGIGAVRFGPQAREFTAIVGQAASLPNSPGRRLTHFHELAALPTLEFEPRRPCDQGSEPFALRLESAILRSQVG